MAGSRRSAGIILGIAVAAALVASASLRIPLIAHAGRHLDSDLAVDGLTMIEASRGVWRWNFPGTPTVGSAPLAILAPLRLAVGNDSLALALGGATLAGLVLLATFALALRRFGRTAALGALVPLAFASTGAIWLSGRITGGHLLVVAWGAIAFLIFGEVVARGGWRRAGVLGLWSGLGIWVDAMFLPTLAGLALAGALAWLTGGSGRSGLRLGLAFAFGFGLGLGPKLLGRLADSRDAYGGQLSASYEPEVLAHHARILALDCLPRLFAGHRLPGLQAEPGGIGGDGQAIPAPAASTAIGVAALAMGAVGGVVAILGLLFPGDDRSGRFVRLAMGFGSAGLVVGFLLNRNIFNSDNYRYLAPLLVPWAIGLGRGLAWIDRRGEGGRAAAIGLAMALAIVATLDARAWYRALGWWGTPPETRPADPMFTWIEAHPEVTSLYGGYWDVYRLSFATGGRVKGIPSGHYPDRFPEWSRDLPGGHASHAIVRPGSVGREIRERVVRESGSVRLRAGDGLLLDWP